MTQRLTVAIDRYGTDGPIICYTRHRLDLQDGEVLKRIRDAAVPLHVSVYWYEDDGLKEHKTDLDGARLTNMAANTLVNLLKGRTLYTFDTALLAYLMAIPPYTRVVLWWD